jgi:hypothetical protein
LQHDTLKVDAHTCRSDLAITTFALPTSQTTIDVSSQQEKNKVAREPRRPDARRSLLRIFHTCENPYQESGGCDCSAIVCAV